MSVAAAPPPPPPPPTDELGQWLVRVTDRPDDVALRLVFADWLLERGDPRGRLMALQLEDERSPPDLMRKVKINVLVRDHGPSWCPPGTRPRAFRRGLPSAVEWNAPTDPAHLAWRSIDTVHCALPEGPVPRGSPFAFARPTLRAVTGVDRQLFAHLLAAPLAGLTQLSVRDVDADAPSLAARALTFPALRTLALRTTAAERDARLGAAQLEQVLRQCATLERLSLSLPALPVAPVLALRARLAPRLTLRFLIDWETLRLPFTLELDPDTGALVVPGHVPGTVTDYAEELGRELGLRLRVLYVAAEAPAR